MYYSYFKLFRIFILLYMYIVRIHESIIYENFALLLVQIPNSLYRCFLPYLQYLLRRPRQRMRSTCSFLTLPCLISSENCRKLPSLFTVASGRFGSTNRVAQKAQKAIVEIKRIRYTLPDASRFRLYSPFVYLRYLNGGGYPVRAQDSCVRSSM